MTMSTFLANARDFASCDGVVAEDERLGNEGPNGA